MAGDLTTIRVTGETFELVRSVYDNGTLFGCADVRDREACERAYGRLQVAMDRLCRHLENLEDRAHIARDNRKHLRFL